MRPLREPLVHFLLAGAALFVAHAWLNRGASEGGDEPGVVRITAAEVEWLTEAWARQWRRPPTDTELRGLVTEYARERLLAREALEMGLDENDTIVRRRLAQKMEFLVEDTARLVEPTEDELHRLYSEGRERYQVPARVSFRQIFFRTEAAARRGMADLSTRDAAELGEPTLLEPEHAGADPQVVTSLFGGEFADRVLALEPGRWEGPVRSAYGFHLVRVSERLAAQQRAFGEVRAQVLDEWQRIQQTRTSERLFAELARKYELVVDESVRPWIAPLADEVR